MSVLVSEKTPQFGFQAVVNGSEFAVNFTL